MDVSKWSVCDNLTRVLWSKADNPDSQNYLTCSMWNRYRCFAGRQPARLFYFPDLDFRLENLVFTKVLHAELATIQLLVFVERTSF
jgi:hypothetical protein